MENRLQRIDANSFKLVLVEDRLLSICLTCNGIVHIRFDDLACGHLNLGWFGLRRMDGGQYQLSEVCTRLYFDEHTMMRLFYQIYNYR
jgi:hypothetical protein